MISSRDRSAWQAFRPFAPPVIYCLCVAAGITLLSLFAYVMGRQAQARADAYVAAPGCTSAVAAPTASSGCRTELATVQNLRLGVARGPTPGFDAHLRDGSVARVDLPHGSNDVILGLAPGDPVEVQTWGGLATVVTVGGRAHPTSDNPLQQADAWFQGAQIGAFALWLPLLAGAWLALRGWILSREPTYD